MDKSFNDQELSDIMKEIEALEDDFTTPEDSATSPVMEKHAEEKTASVTSLDSHRPAAKTTSTTTGTSMSFKVQGDLTLELKFDIGGKIVCLEVTESGLAIEMEGGVKFTVPVAEHSALKKAI